MGLTNLVGKRVKYDIIHNGLLLIPTGITLDHDHIQLLEKYRMDEMDLILMDAEDTESAGAPSLMLQAAGYTRNLFERLQAGGKLPHSEIAHELIPMVQELSEHTDLFQLFKTVRAKDEYTHQHNIGVGVLSTLIGRWLHWEESELSLLSLAATLHDVGKIRISNDILLKPGKLTPEEYEEIKRHSIYGYEILKENEGLNPRVALVALQHHERADGKGYPQALRQHQMDPMSKIVAVADVFHAMSSKRPYHDPMPFYEVVGQMRKGSFGELDPWVVSVFIQQIVRHLVGRQIKLSNGQWGEVVYINPHDELHPLVQIGEDFMDLSQEPNIHIQEIVI